MGFRMEHLKGHVHQPLIILSFILLSARLAPAATVSLPDATIPNPGATTIVDVSVDSVTGLEAVDLVITFDSAIVSATAVSKSPGTSACGDPVGDENPAGTFSVGMECALNPFTGGGSIMRITFQGTAVGSTTLHFTTCLLNEVSCSTSDGSITVQGPTSTPSHTATATATGTSTATSQYSLTPTPTSTPPGPQCAVFPPAGSDSFDTTAVVTVQILLLGVTETVALSGPTEIQRGDPFDPGDGRREIPTEIVSMSLTGSSPILGPLTLIESPTLASLGRVKAQNVGADFPADSFFDVFFEIETTLAPPLDRLHNADPLRMHQVIDCIPPLGAIYQPPPGGQRIPLYDAANARVALLIHAQHEVISPVCGDGILDPGEECDDGNNVDCDGCDRNCTLTRCGNVVLCPPEECDDGNTVGGDGCSASCVREPACGDGILDPGEECDDGSPFPGDCCDQFCRFEPLSTPCEGDGNLCTTDHCDGAGSCVLLDQVVCSDDGDVCNGPETCNPFSGCASGPPAPLSTPCEADGNSCTTDHCDGNGECVLLKMCPPIKAAALCQKQVGKEGRKFKKKKLKAWQKCLDGILAGKGCDAADRDATIAAAEARFVTNVAKKCTAELLFGPPPDGLGFPQSCDFEAGPLEPAKEACRALPVNDPDSLTRCFICWKQAELHELLKILYPCLASQVPEGSDLDCGTPPAMCPTEKDEVRCTQAIAKAGINFFITKEKALEQCLDAVRRAKIPGPCPDAEAQAKIDAAEQKKMAQMEACQQVPPWWDVCPEDSAAPCDQSITSVADIGICVGTAVEAIADEVVCQQYTGAAGDGIPCPAPDGP